MTVKGGELVREWRLKQALSQEELARVLEVTQATVKNIELNKNISVSNAKKLAPLLGVTIGYFYEDEKE